MLFISMTKGWMVCLPEKSSDRRKGTARNGANDQLSSDEASQVADLLIRVKASRSIVRNQKRN